MHAKMKAKVMLAWAVPAKNSYPMIGGFSSFQLVFGKQPKVPNDMVDKLPALEGVTTSKSLAMHITAMHAGRKAFTEALYNEKVQKALRHNVRAVERVYLQGEDVYYRRDSDRAAWRGPITVLESLGSVYFLVHQEDVVRVAASRIVATEDVDRQISMKDKETAQVPTNCVKETEEKEAPGVDIEAGQQEQEPAPEDTERHEPERPELTKRLEEPEGQVIKGPDPERL